ncbi:MAG: CHAT domain-containing protein [bacterium]
MKQAIYLEIIRKGPHLETSLSKGEQTLTHYEESPVSPEELGRRCNELMHLLNMVSRRGAIPTSVIEEMQQMGRVLYNEIFPLSIKSQLYECPPSDLILRIDNTLVHVPWELLFDGQHFLCEKFNIGRMVKTQQIVAKRMETRPSFPFRILIIADPRSDLKASYEEGKRIRDQLQTEDVKVTLVTSEVSRDFIKKRLFNFDLIHYAGHADYDLKNPSQSGWLLEDGKFTTLDIRKMGGSNPLPWMVFSNACQSGQTEEWRVDEEGEEKIYGLANAFLLSGVQHYIGTFWKVLDEPSTNFALEFYGHLLKGASVGESMRSARLGLRGSYGEGNILWASYLLYGDPGVRYFPKEHGEDEEENLLAASGVASTQAQKYQEVYIQKNGLHTRSASKDDNNVYGWRLRNGQQKDSSPKKKGFSKRLFFSIGGIVLGIFLVFGIMQYKIRINHNKSIDTIEAPGPGAENLDQLGELVKAGIASDDQMADFFQGLVKKYHRENTQSAEERDQWTSRPVAFFFVARNSSDSKEARINAEADRLIHKLMALLGQDSRITILEREYLDTLLKELDLGSSPLADPDHGLRLGQIVAGNLFSICSINRFENTWQINLRIIASETSRVEAAISERWADLESLDEVTEGLVKKLLNAIEQAFPIQGRIKHYFNDKKIMLNIGYREGVEKGMKFYAFKEIEILDSVGDAIAKDKVSVASLLVTEVKEDFCFVEVLDRSEDLSPGMKVSVLNI